MASNQRARKKVDFQKINDLRNALEAQEYAARVFNNNQNTAPVSSGASLDIPVATKSSARNLPQISGGVKKIGGDEAATIVKQIANTPDVTADQMRRQALNAANSDNVEASRMQTLADDQRRQRATEQIQRPRVAAQQAAATSADDKRRAAYEQERARKQAERNRVQYNPNSQYADIYERYADLQENENTNAVSRAMKSDLMPTQQRNDLLAERQYYERLLGMAAAGQPIDNQELRIARSRVAYIDNLLAEDSRLQVAYNERIRSEEYTRDEANAAQYEIVRENKDFEALAKYAMTDREGYDPFVDNPAFYAAKMIAETGEVPNGSGSAYLYMTDDEAKTYSYYIAQGDRGKADDYFSSIKHRLNERMANAQYANLYEWSKDHPFLAGVASVGANLGSFAGYAAGVGQNIENAITGIDRPIDTNSSAFLPTRATQIMREGVTADMGKTGRFLTSTGLSIADMAANYLLYGFGGSAAIEAGFFGTAAGSATYEAAERGLSAGQATAIGTAAGLAEVLAEKLPIDNLIKLADGPVALISKQGVKEILKQAGMEATEEVLTEYANTLTDIAVAGNQSQYAQYIQQLVASGMTPEEAEHQANIQFFIVQPAEAGAAGAVSGGVMGGGAIAMGGGLVSPRVQQTPAQNTTGQHEAASPYSPETQQALDNSTAAQRTAVELAIRSDRTATEDAALAVLSGREIDQATLLEIRDNPTDRKKFKDLAGVSLDGDASTISARVSAAVKENAGNAEVVNDIVGMMQRDAQQTQTVPTSAIESALQTAADTQSGAIEQAQPESMYAPAKQTAPAIGGFFSRYLPDNTVPGGENAVDNALATAANTLNVGQTYTVGEGNDYSTADMSTAQRTALNRAETALSGLGISADVSARTANDVYTQTAAQLAEYVDETSGFAALKQYADESGVPVEELIRTALSGKETGVSGRAKTELTGIVSGTYRGGKIRYLAKKNGPHGVFENALSKVDWARFHRAVSYRFDNAGLVIEDYAVLLYDKDDLSTSKLICYNGENDPEITVVFELEKFDETIHDAVNDTARLIAKGVNNGYNENQIRAICKNATKANGILFRRYSSKSLRYSRFGYVPTNTRSGGDSQNGAGDAEKNRADRGSDEEVIPNPADASSPRYLAAKKPKQSEQESAAPDLRQQTAETITIKTREGKATVNAVSVMDTLAQIEMDDKRNGTDNLRTATAEIRRIQQMQKAFGLKVVFCDGTITFAKKSMGTQTFDGGMWHNGVVYVNAANIGQSSVFVAAHELGHEISENDPELLREFHDLCLEYAKRTGKEAEFEAALNKIYHEQRIGSDSQALISEYFSNQLGKLWSNEDFVAWATGNKPTVWQRIAAAVRRFVDRLRNGGFTREARYFEEQEAYILKKLDDYRVSHGGESTLSNRTKRLAARAQQRADSLNGKYVMRSAQDIEHEGFDEDVDAVNKTVRQMPKRLPQENTDYGLRKITVGGLNHTVFAVNPDMKISTKRNIQAPYANTVAAARELAAVFGYKIGFVAGNTIVEDKKGAERAFPYDSVLADDGTIYINLNAKRPYTSIVGTMFWTQLKRDNPKTANEITRAMRRIKNLKPGAEISGEDLVMSLFGRNTAALKGTSEGAKAVVLNPGELIERLSVDPNLARALEHEAPSAARRMVEAIGDALTRTENKSMRATRVLRQAQARVLKAFSEQAETARETEQGTPVPKAQARQKTPGDMRLLYAGENARTADTSALDRAKSMIADGADPETVRQVASQPQTAPPRLTESLFRKQYMLGMRKGRAEVRDTYKRRDLRDGIRGRVKKINKALLTPTDVSHVPERLQGAITNFLKEFTGDTSVFTRTQLVYLKDAYSRINETAEDAEYGVSYAYDPEIAGMIGELADTIDGRRLSELSYEETQKVSDIVKHFYHLVRDENKIEIRGKRERVEKLGLSIMRDMDKLPAASDSRLSGSAKAFADMLASDNITPAYFFKRLGGTVETLFKSMRDGQNVWARRMDGARKTYEDIYRRHHAKAWLDKKGDVLEMKTERGEDIRLTRQQALTLYATWKREVTNRVQDAGHLSMGGFVYENAVSRKKGQVSVDTTRAHPLSANDMGKIMAWLTDEQRAFADELVAYMSGELAQYGNEASVQLHGWEKFNEKYYFPYNSASNYLYSQSAVTDDTRLKYMSFTKATVRKANNPIILSDFTKVWANHVQSMMLYSSLAVPLENFNRVFNFRTPVLPNSSGTSVKEAIERAYGKRANTYIKQLMKDINGGVQSNPSEGLLNSLLSKFKKSAVFASASVVVQQPSSIVRAMAMVDPKYFVPTTTPMRSYEECMKYCGTAIIKRMGRFDTNTGRGAAEWLIARPYEKISEKAAAVVTDSSYRDEALSAAASKADEISWGFLWNAVKREQVKEHGYKPGSPELFKAAAERFDEVVNFTQVYDSVFARSQMMRSQGLGAKITTNFMSEPTVAYNMLFDAFANAKRTDVKNKVSPQRAVAAFLATGLVNSILKSIVTAARDDDKDKTYWEKYLGAVAGNFADSANVLGLVPLARDISSILQGYSVDNPFFELPERTVKAAQNMFEWLSGNSNKSGGDVTWALVETVSDWFGVPLKNMRRDIKAVFNVFKPGDTETTRTGVLDSVLDALPMYDNTNSRNYQRLFDAYEDNNEQRMERITGILAENGVSESSIESGVRSVCRDKYIAGSVTQAEAEKFLSEFCGQTEDEAYWTIVSWDYRAEHPEYSGTWSDYTLLYDAIAEGDRRTIQQEIDRLLEHGKEARNIKATITRKYGSGYLDDYDLG